MSTANLLCDRCHGHGKLHGQTCWHCRGMGTQLFADLFWHAAQKLPGTLSEVSAEAFQIATVGYRQGEKA